jgi:uncharacterized protein (TIGR03083 family)
MSTPLSNAEIANGLLGAYEGFAQMLGHLDDAKWTTPTRCAGWEVRDVAGHVVGLAHDAATGVPGRRTPDEQAAALRDYEPADLAAQLLATVTSLRALVDVLDDAAWSGPSGVEGVTLARGVQGLWWDTYAHQDDVHEALGFGADRGPSLAASVAYLAYQLTTRGWGPATLALDSLPQIDIGAGGETIAGDPYQFVLVASGRADAETMGLDPSVNVYAL